MSAWLILLSPVPEYVARFKEELRGKIVAANVVG